MPGSGVRRGLILQLLGEQDVPASWELGRGAALVDGKDNAMLSGLVRVFPVSPSALIGYLSGLQAAGDEFAFDDFLDSELAHSLGTRDRIIIAVRAPATDSARERILTGIRDLPVAEATYALFGWRQNLSQNELANILHDWIGRIQSQDDYNAVLDWLNLALHVEEVLPSALREDTWRLVMQRADFPEVGGQRWDWSRLAGLLVPERGAELARLVLNLIEADQLTIIGGDYDAVLLGQCAQSHGDLIWTEVAARITSAGAWRLQMELRGWFLDHVSPDVVVAWVGADVERARVVASMASVGGDEPTAIARFPLAGFGDDREVAGSLYTTLVSGFWTGNQSNRIASQVEQLNMWRRRRTEPAGVRNWAWKAIESLEQDLRVALHREAEEAH